MDHRNPRDPLGLHLPLKHVMLAPLELEALRTRAPGVVQSLVTYQRETLVGERGEKPRPAPVGAAS
jgi:hypothetical protein